MSVLVSTNDGYFISHQDYIRKIYSHVEIDGSVCSFQYRPEMFLINTPFKKDLEAQKDASGENAANIIKNRKRKRCRDVMNIVTHRVQTQAKSLLGAAQQKGLLSHKVTDIDISDNNGAARILSDECYKTSREFSLLSTFVGANETPKTRLEMFGGHQFLFPRDCRFFCSDVLKMEEKIDDIGRFDLIVIDPPWWNKYIRRKRAHGEADGYKMLSCDDLLKMPVSQLLNPGALVAVWCTNADSHLSNLKNLLMPAWGIKHVASWCWLKITTSGEPVCPYARPPGKQPFEQLLFGVEAASTVNSRIQPWPEDGKLLISVPSAIHSHKPPLLDVLKEFLPAEPKCLEIFARSLLPGCSSWGLEVLKLQHISLFNRLNFTSAAEALVSTKM